MPANFNSSAKFSPEYSYKWGRYDRDVIPLWVADMDFPVAEEIQQALHKRWEQGVYPYERVSDEFYDVVCSRLKECCSLNVIRDDIEICPGLLAALNATHLAYAEANEEIVTLTPVYQHFLMDPVSLQRKVIQVPMFRGAGGYGIDFDLLEKSISPASRTLLLCNPHNPVGRVYAIEEISQLAETALRHRLVIVSDEVHCDLVFPGHRHISIASLSAEVAARTVTLMSASKGFNLSGLSLGYAVIQNRELWKKFRRISEPLFPGPGVFAQRATIAAYRSGGSWLEGLMRHLAGNVRLLKDFSNRLGGHPVVSDLEGTYLAWLDFREMGISSPGSFFLEKAKVAMVEGAIFGKGGEGFCRMNLACPEARLREALLRMEAALRFR